MEGSPRLLINERSIDQLIDFIVEQTSGCSVEQLEQVYSAIMNEIWQTRGDWNRTYVASRVKKRFQLEIDDIREIQGQDTGSMDFA